MYYNKVKTNEMRSKKKPLTFRIYFTKSRYMQVHKNTTQCKEYANILEVNYVFPSLPILKTHSGNKQQAQCQDTILEQSIAIILVF